MRGRTVVLTILLLAGVAAGCSDDGDDGGDARQPYVDAVVESLQDNADSGFTPSDEQATCMAETSVDALGVDFLEANDITPEDLAEAASPAELDVEISEAQARGAARGFVDCDISLIEQYAASAGFELSDEAAACIDENLDEEAIVDAIAAQYLGNDEEATAAFGTMFSTITTACGELMGG